MSAFLNVDPSGIVITMIKQGSIKFIIDIPERPLDELKNALSSESYQTLLQADIQTIQINKSEIMVLDKNNKYITKPLEESLLLVNIFISYSKDNKDLFERLNKHLINLKKEEYVYGWYEYCINDSVDWLEVRNYLDKSEIIILLFSPDFLASSNNYLKLLNYTATKVHNGDAIAIPVLLQPMEYDLDTYIRYFLLPKNEKAITSWQNQDEAFVSVQKSIKEIIKHKETNLKLIANIIKQNSSFNNPMDQTNQLGEDNKLDPRTGSILDSNKEATDETISTIPFIKQQYLSVEKYIPRKIVSVNNHSISNFIDRNSSEDIKKIIEKEHRIVLVADGGVGKTTELDNIAAYYSNESTFFYPFLIKLNTYVNEEICQLLDSIDQNWREIQQEKLLIILDGLDEVESKNSNDAIRRIEKFSKDYPKTHILISCRINFYRFQTSNQSGSLKNYLAYLLLEPDKKQIEDYITKELGTNAHKFDKSVTDKQLDTLLAIPFYLITLISLFKTNNTLPKSKAEIFENLVEFRFLEDKEKYRTTVENLHWNNHLYLINNSLEQIALGMEILRRNYITGQEFQELVTDNNLRQLLHFCSIWKKKIPSSKNTWEFEHRHFQEYFAARLLSKQEISAIKEIVSISSKQKDIAYWWTNTLSFLISLINKGNNKFSELLNWVNDVAPNLIVDFEPDKIDVKTRLGYIKNILEKHKNKRLKPDYSEKYYIELANFGQSNELIDYLVEIIRTTNDTDNLHFVSNSLDILRYLTIPESKKEIVAQVLIDCSINSPLGNSLQNKATIALADLNLHSENVINKLTKTFRESNNLLLRQGLYYVLYNSSYLEDNIDIFLEGFKYASYRSNEYSEHISNGLSKIKSPEIILKVIYYLTDNLDLLQRLELTQRQEFRYNDLINNAAQAYLEQIHLQDHSILESIISLVLRATQTYNHTLAYIFVKFFDIINSRFSTFEIFFDYFSVDSFNSENRKHLLKFLAVLADTKCIDFFIHKYKENPFSDEYIWFFYNSLSDFNKEVFGYFEKEINLISNNKFLTKSVEHLFQKEQERLKENIELLFDKIAFLEKAKQIFDDTKKIELTKEEIVSIKINNQKEHTYPTLVLQTLQELASKEEENEEDFASPTPTTISLQEVQEAKWNWDWFCVSKLHSLFENHKQLPLSKSQIKWIEDFCFSNLHKVDFKTALVTNSPDESSTNYLAIYLWCFLRKLNFDFPKDVLLDLLSFDWSEKEADSYHLQYVGIDYLEKKLPFEEMKNRILLNLQIGIKNRDVLNNHLKFCTKHKIKKAINYITHILTNPTTYNLWSRQSVLRAIYELSDKDLSLLEATLPSILDNFKWEIVDLIVEKSEFCKEYLRKFLQNAQDKNEKLTATHYLIPFEEIGALDYYVSYFEQGHEDSYFSSRLERFQCPLESLKNKVSDSFAEKSIPLLMRLLKASYQPQYLTGNFLTLNQTTLSVLQSLAMKSDDFYSKIKTSIETFITDNSEIPYVKNLQGFLDYLEKNYYLNKAQSISVKEVVSKLNSLIQ